MLGPMTKIAYQTITMNVLAHNDQPISAPSEDRFGVDPFARAIAGSIQKLQSPNGSVIALNGPWGSGKSSAVNLIRHHLDAVVKSEELVIIDFTCWWFRGEDALALAFFRELYAGLSPSLGDKIKKSLPKLGARLLRAGSVIGGAADAAGAGGIGAAAGGAMEWLGSLIQQDESVEKLHGELSKALSEQNKRFLIVIDDIDRLSPDEALLIFRLVKSVGRLPNVLYLLVYDRQLAEKIVSERYPSEGPHYLEKIVQAAFELPEPSATDVQQLLLGQIATICGTPSDEEVIRFMNIFHAGVAPAMRTPRDVARFTNSLSVTWPAVAGEVDRADFLALEVMRLLHPTIYRSIRQNKALVCGGTSSDGRDREATAKHLQKLFFDESNGSDEGRLRRLLMRLFPALESVWGNMSYGGGFARQWGMERRVCSAAHFDSYFRFAVGEEVLPRAELDAFIKQAGDRDFVKATMRHAITVFRKTGGTKAAVLLTELNTHAERIAKEAILPLLSALFEIADEINVEADAARGFSLGNNELRLHWLLRSLTRERLTLAERSEALVRACEAAQVGWLASFTSSAWKEHHPEEAKHQKPTEECLTLEADATRLRTMLLERIEVAAGNGTLAGHRDLGFLLYSWTELAGDEGAAARAWTATRYAADEGVIQLAKSFTSHGWSQSWGDTVAKRTTQVHITALNNFIDIQAFRKRVEEVAAQGTSPEVQEFLDAWRRADRGDDD